MLQRVNQVRLCSIMGNYLCADLSESNEVVTKNGVIVGRVNMLTANITSTKLAS